MSNNQHLAQAALDAIAASFRASVNHGDNSAEAESARGAAREALAAAKAAGVTSEEIWAPAHS